MFISSCFFIKDKTLNIPGFYANSKLISIMGDNGLFPLRELIFFNVLILNAGLPGSKRRNKIPGIVLPFNISPPTGINLRI